MLSSVVAWTVQKPSTCRETQTWSSSTWWGLSSLSCMGDTDTVVLEFDLEDPDLDIVFYKLDPDTVF